MDEYFYDDEYGVIFADRDHKHFYVRNTVNDIPFQGYENFIYAYGIAKGDRDTWNVHYEEITHGLSVHDAETKYAFWIEKMIKNMSFSELRDLNSKFNTNGLMASSVLNKFNEIIRDEYKIRISNFLFKAFLFVFSIFLIALCTLYADDSLLRSITSFLGAFIFLSAFSLLAEFQSYYSDSPHNYTYDKYFSMILFSSFSFAILPIFFKLL